MSTEKTEEKKSKKSKWLILLLLLIIFILIGVIFFMWKNSRSKEGDSVERNVIVNDENAEEIASKLLNEERVPLGRYEVTMNTTWNFKNGSSASDDAYVANAEVNTNSVYFDLVRSDTEEVVLASPIIPVGSHMNKITLDKRLAKGSYACVCTYHLIDDENKPISKVSVGVTVNVLN